MYSDEEPSTSARSKQFKTRNIDAENECSYPVTFEEFMKFVKVEEYVVKEMKLAGPKVYKYLYKDRHKYYPGVYKDFYKNEEERRKMFRHGLSIKPMPNFFKEKFMRMPAATEQSKLNTNQKEDYVSTVKDQEKSQPKMKSLAENPKQSDLLENKNVKPKIKDKENEKKSKIKSVPKAANRANRPTKSKPEIDSPKITNFFSSLQLKKNDRKRKSDSSDSIPLAKRFREPKKSVPLSKIRVESKDIASDDSDIQSNLQVDRTGKAQEKHTKNPKINVKDSKNPRRNKTIISIDSSVSATKKGKHAHEENRKQLGASDVDMKLLSPSGIGNRLAASSTDIHAWLDNGLKALKKKKYVEWNILEYFDDQIMLRSNQDAIKLYPNDLKTYIEYLLNVEIQKRDGPSFKLPGHKISTRSRVVIKFLFMTFDDYKLLVNGEEHTDEKLARKLYETIVIRRIWPTEVHFKLSALKDFLKRKSYKGPLELKDIPPGLLSLEEFIQHTNIKDCLRAQCADSETQLLDQCREALATCCKRGDWRKISGIQLRPEAIAENDEAVSENSAKESLSIPQIGKSPTDIETLQNATTQRVSAELNSEDKFEEVNEIDTLERNLEYIFKETQEQSNIAMSLDDREMEQNNNSSEKNFGETSVEQKTAHEVTPLISDLPITVASDSPPVLIPLEKRVLTRNEAAKSPENSGTIPPSPNIFQTIGESDPKVGQTQDVVVSTPEAVYLPFDRSATLLEQDCLSSDPFAVVIKNESESESRACAVNLSNVNENIIKLEPHSVPHISKGNSDDSCQIIELSASEPIVIKEEDSTQDLLEMLASLSENNDSTPLQTVNATPNNSSLEIFPQAQRLPSNFELTLSHPNIRKTHQTLDPQKEKECDEVSNFELNEKNLSEDIDSAFVLSIFENEENTCPEGRTVDSIAIERKTSDLTMPPYVSHEENTCPEARTVDSIAIERETSDLTMPPYVSHEENNCPEARTVDSIAIERKTSDLTMPPYVSHEENNCPEARTVDSIAIERKTSDLTMPPYVSHEENTCPEARTVDSIAIERKTSDLTMPPYVSHEENNCPEARTVDSIAIERKTSDLTMPPYVSHEENNCPEARTVDSIAIERKTSDLTMPPYVSHEENTCPEARTVDSIAIERKTSDLTMPPYVSHEVTVDNSNQTLGKGFASVEQNSTWLVSENLSSIEEVTKGNPNKSLRVENENQPDIICCSSNGFQIRNISGSVQSNDKCLIEDIEKPAMASFLHGPNEIQEGKKSETSLVLEVVDVTEDVAIEKKLNCELISAGKSKSQTGIPGETKFLKNVEGTTTSEYMITEKISYPRTIDLLSEEMSDSSNSVILVEESEDESNDDSNVGLVKGVDNEVKISSGDNDLIHTPAANEVTSFQKELCPATDKNEPESVRLNLKSSDNCQSVVNALSNKAAYDLKPGENRLPLCDLLKENDSSIANNSKNTELSTPMNSSTERPLAMPNAACVDKFITEEVMVNTHQNQLNSKPAIGSVDKPVEEASKIISHKQRKSKPQISTQIEHTTVSHEAMDVVESPSQQSLPPEFQALLTIGAFINASMDTDNEHNDEKLVKMTFNISVKNIKFLKSYLTPEIKNQQDAIKSLISRNFFNLTINDEDICGVTKSMPENSQASKSKSCSVIGLQFRPEMFNYFSFATETETKASSGNVKVNVPSIICKSQRDTHKQKGRHNVKSQNTAFQELQTAVCKKPVDRKAAAKHKTKKSEQDFVLQKIHTFRSLPLGQAKKPASSENISNQPLEKNTEVVASSTASQILGTDCTIFESSQLLRNIGEECHPLEEPQATSNEGHHHPLPELQK